MCDSSYRNEPGRIVDDVNNPPVTDSDTPVVFVASQLLTSCRTGITAQSRNFTVDATEQSVVERIEFFLRRVLNLKTIIRHASGFVSAG
jgi:hypothetical protein